MNDHDTSNTRNPMNCLSKNTSYGISLSSGSNSGVPVLDKDVDELLKMYRTLFQITPLVLHLLADISHTTDPVRQTRIRKAGRDLAGVFEHCNIF